MEYIVVNEYPEQSLAADWHDFLSSASFASHYVAPEYFHEPHFGNTRPFAILIAEGSKIVCVLTGVLIHGQVSCGLAVRPQVCIADNVDVEKIAGQIATAVKSIGGSDFLFHSLHSWKPLPGLLGQGFRETVSSGESRVVMLDVNRGSEEIFSEFSSSRRNNLRKAMRRNEVEISELLEESDFRTLHEIHVNWSDSKGIPHLPFETLRSAWKLKKNRKILVAKSNGKVIAGSYFRFYPGGVVEYAGNNSDPDELALRPNDLLMWKAIEWACSSNFRYFSMGGSHTFLQRFGGEIVSTYQYDRDLTLFRKHRVVGAARNLMLSGYRLLPATAQKRLKAFVK